MLAYKLHARIFGYVTKQCAMTHPLSMELTYELSSDLFGSWQPIKKVECVSKFFVPFTMSEWNTTRCYRIHVYTKIDSLPCIYYCYLPSINMRFARGDEDPQNKNIILARAFHHPPPSLFHLYVLILLSECRRAGLQSSQMTVKKCMTFNFYSNCKKYFDILNLNYLSHVIRPWENHITLISSKFCWQNHLPKVQLNYFSEVYPYIL